MIPKVTDSHHHNGSLFSFEIAGRSKRAQAEREGGGAPHYQSSDGGCLFCSREACTARIYPRTPPTPTLSWTPYSRPPRGPTSSAMRRGEGTSRRSEGRGGGTSRRSEGRLGSAFALSSSPSSWGRAPSDSPTPSPRSDTGLEWRSCSSSWRSAFTPECYCGAW